MENQIYEGFIVVNKQQFQENKNSLITNDKFILSKNITEKASSDYLCIFDLKYKDSIPVDNKVYICLHITYQRANSLVTLQNNLLKVKTLIKNKKITSINMLKNHIDSYISCIEHTKELGLQDSKLNNNIQFVYIFNPACILNCSSLNNDSKPTKVIDSTNSNIYTTNKDKPNNQNESFAYFWKYIWNIPQYKGWVHIFIWVLPLIAFILGLIIGRIV